MCRVLAGISSILLSVACASSSTMPGADGDSTRPIHEAEGLARSGDTGRAIERLTEALRRDPGRVDALALRGHVRLASGDATGVDDLKAALRRNIEVWTVARRSAPGDVRLPVRIAVAQLELGEPEAARSTLDEALREHPQHAQALFQRGNARARLGDLPGALADYDGAIRSDASLVPCYVARADVHQHLGHEQSAISDLTTARNLLARAELR